MCQRTTTRSLGIFLCLLLASPAWANIGPRWWGDRLAEPLGLKDVDILSEKLTIDLRPLVAVQPVEVEAIYHLNNTGSTKKLDLLFVTGVSGVRDFEVRLDGRLVPNKQVSFKEQRDQGYEFPKSWQPPDDLPGIDFPHSQSHVYRHLENPIMLAFVLELPPGRSILSAHYRARAYGEDEGYPIVTWLFPYILAPAREWKSFGGLDVTAYLPEGWQSNSSPELNREADVLHGSFPTLPADCLAVAVRRPMGPELQQKMRYTIGGFVVLYALVAIGGGIFCWGAGRVFGHVVVRKTSSISTARHRLVLCLIPFAPLMTACWAAAILGTGKLARDGIYGVLAGQESPYFHEHFSLPLHGQFCLILIVLPAGIFLTWSGAWRSLHLTEYSPATNKAASAS